MILKELSVEKNIEITNIGFFEKFNKDYVKPINGEFFLKKDSYLHF